MPEIPSSPAGTILLVAVGTAAHGTVHAGGGERGEQGVVVEPADEVLGLDDGGCRTTVQRTQPAGWRSGPGDVDRTLHPLRRFLRLAADGSPSLLVALWAPVITATGLGLELRAVGDAFVGRHLVASHRGQLQSQVRRLLAARDHGGGDDGEAAAACARLGFQAVELLTTGGLELPGRGEPADWLAAVRRGAVPFAEWHDRCAGLVAALDGLERDAALPVGPDRERIAAWSVRAHRMAWAGDDGLALVAA